MSEWRITEAGEPPDAGWYLHLGSDNPPMLFNAAQLGKLEAIVEAHNRKEGDATCSQAPDTRVSNAAPTFEPKAAAEIPYQNYPLLKAEHEKFIHFGKADKVIGADSEETCYEFTYGKKMPEADKQLREIAEKLCRILQAKPNSFHPDGRPLDVMETVTRAMQEWACHEVAALTKQLLDDNTRLRQRIYEKDEKIQESESKAEEQGKRALELFDECKRLQADKGRLDWLDRQRGWTRETIDKEMKR